MRNNTPRCASSSLPQSGTRHLACATCKVRCRHALSELSMHLLELFLDPRVERAHSDTPPLVRRERDSSRALDHQ